MSRKLRFGILCDEPIFAAWQAKCINKLTGDDIAELALMIVPFSNQKVSGRIHPARNPRTLLFRLYLRFFVDPFSAAMEMTGLTQEQSVVPQINCRVGSAADHSKDVSEEDLEIIRSYGLDLILDFSSYSIGSALPASSRLGVWSFRHGDTEKLNRMLPGFWEIYRSRLTTEATLQRLTGEQGASIVLYSGTLKTNAMSYKANRDNVLMQTAGWCANVCKRILADTMDASPTLHSATGHQTCELPTNRQFLLFLLKLYRNRLRWVLQKMFFLEIWNIGFLNGPPADLLRSQIAQCQWLDKKNKYRFLADPFALVSGQSTYIFAEDYDYVRSRKRAHISVAKLSDDTDATSFEESVTRTCHLSYPYLLEHEERIYCVPESSGLRQVQLLGAVKFPKEWEVSRVLIEGFAAVDSTIFQHDGRWWLFCTNEDDEPNTNLYCFHAADLLGDWVAHSLNPVKCDVSSARPGGRPFRVDGKLYRPAQDCSGNYGGAISINRILSLSPTSFDEACVARISPDPKGPYPDGVHTICHLGEAAMVDGLRYTFFWNAGLVRAYQAFMGFFPRERLNDAR